MRAVINRTDDEPFNFRAIVESAAAYMTNQPTTNYLVLKIENIDEKSNHPEKDFESRTDSERFTGGCQGHVGGCGRRDHILW